MSDPSSSAPPDAADAPDQGADAANEAVDVSADVTTPDGQAADGQAAEGQAADAEPAVRLRPRLAEPKPDQAVCSVELEQFEGPLDLLLHLVRRHELDILDIPISFVCEKYLEYIEVMRALDLEVAGDYLVMAATLAFLKSRELVPAEPLEEGAEEGAEEGGDPREELVARLLMYQKFRAAADQLDALPLSGRDTFLRGQSIDLPPVDAGLAPITLYRLAEAYHRVLDRARILKSHEVVMETISVAARMEQLTLILMKRERVEFEALFLERQWSSERELRSMLVVTLMSILELVRMGVAGVKQPEGTTALVIERRASEAEARRALAEYDESLSFGDPNAVASEADEVEPEVEVDVDGEESGEKWQSSSETSAQWEDADHEPAAAQPDDADSSAADVDADDVDVDVDTVDTDAAADVDADAADDADLGAADDADTDAEDADAANDADADVADEADTDTADDAETDVEDDVDADTADDAHTGAADDADTGDRDAADFGATDAGDAEEVDAWAKLVSDDANGAAASDDAWLDRADAAFAEGVGAVPTASATERADGDSAAVAPAQRPQLLADTDDALTDNADTDNALTDNADTDNALTDNALTDNALTDTALTDTALTDTALTDDPLTDNALTDDALTDDADTDGAREPSADAAPEAEDATSGADAAQSGESRVQFESAPDPTTVREDGDVTEGTAAGTASAPTLRDDPTLEPPDEPAPADSDD